MQMDKRFNRFKKGTELLQVAKTEAVIYTRVSTKEQADNLTRKLLNAIRTRDAGRFARTVRRSNAN